MSLRPFGTTILSVALASLCILTGALPAAAQSPREMSVEESNALLDRINRLYTSGSYAQAVPLASRYAEAMKARHGAGSKEYAVALNNVAQLLQNANRLAEAEPVMRRALAVYQSALGTQHPDVAGALSNLAQLLKHTGRFAEAEPLFRRALAIYEKQLGPNHPKVAICLGNFAQLLRSINRVAEAEPLMRRALAIDEKSFGANHPSVAASLTNLASFLVTTGLHAEGELLYRRALAIYERNLGAEHPSVATVLNNLSHLLQGTNRLAEAEPLIRRALAIDEKRLGGNHSSVATALGNLADILMSTDRLREAEAMMRRALTIDQSSFGKAHPSVALRLGNLASLLHETDRTAEAEPLLRRALEIKEKSFGSGHPEVAADLNQLALMRAAAGDWAEAVRLYRRSVPIMVDVYGKTAESHSNAKLAKLQLSRNTWNFRAAARAIHRSESASAEALDEAFKIAQWSLQTGAADALAQMATRFAKGDGQLAGTLRERQDLITQRQEQDRSLLAAVGKADTRVTEASRRAIGEIDARIASVDKKLAAEFPDYARLAIGTPLAIAEVQELLRPDEALVLFVDLFSLSKLPEETLAWLVTKQEARWISVPLGSTSLSRRAAKLRCGLDRDGNWSWSTSLQKWEAKHDHCRELKPGGLARDEPLPFDVKVAHDLYRELLAPFSAMTPQKRLIIVPAGALTSLPFHVLVAAPHPSTSEPTDGKRGAASEAPAVLTDYRNVAWLALQQPISVLPSVASLRTLRRLPPSKAREPYIAFGNPLLNGRANDPEHQQWAKLSRERQSCGPVSNPRDQYAANDGRAPSRGALLSRGVSLAVLRAQSPLPDTAEELCIVGHALGALERESESIWLGKRATERTLKTLSREGTLARYRVVHFATHGVLASESEAILNAKAEPALLLTPPPDGGTTLQLEEDDGLLMASEVAQLNLDADWVVLSACNTAAGEKGDGETLSGLARAFFYAKARAILVAHWYVDSAAAVKLTTGAFEALTAEPAIGRSEALRRSMVQLISASQSEAHPTFWAPFVLVGDDGR